MSCFWCALCADAVRSLFSVYVYLGLWVWRCVNRSSIPSSDRYNGITLMRLVSLGYKLPSVIHKAIYASSSAAAVDSTGPSLGAAGGEKNGLPSSPASSCSRNVSHSSINCNQSASGSYTPAGYSLLSAPPLRSLKTSQPQT